MLALADLLPPSGRTEYPIGSNQAVINHSDSGLLIQIADAIDDGSWVGNFFDVTSRCSVSNRGVSLIAARLLALFQSPTFFIKNLIDADRRHFHRT